MSTLLDTTLQSIAAELEKGVAPWRQPWANGQCPTLPKRADGQTFSGMNAVMLVDRRQKRDPRRM